MIIVHVSSIINIVYTVFPTIIIVICHQYYAITQVFKLLTHFKNIQIIFGALIDTRSIEFHLIIFTIRRRWRQVISVPRFSGRMRRRMTGWRLRWRPDYRRGVGGGVHRVRAGVWNLLSMFCRSFVRSGMQMVVFVFLAVLVVWVVFVLGCWLWSGWCLWSGWGVWSGCSTAPACRGYISYCGARWLWYIICRSFCFSGQ